MTALPPSSLHAESAIGSPQRSLGDRGRGAQNIAREPALCRSRSMGFGDVPTAHLRIGAESGMQRRLVPRTAALLGLLLDDR
jgi:hypothetical protein